jgi:hypothetical protein
MFKGEHIILGKDQVLEKVCWNLCVCVCVVIGDDGQSPLQIVVVCNSLSHNQEIPRLILSPDNDYPVLVSAQFLRVYVGIVR